jgi:two-component sensor histidine kinase
VDEIDLGGYLAALSGNLVNFHAAGRDGIRAEHHHAAISVRPELAVNLGLVVNEFVTNSLKHASDGDLLLSTMIEVGEGHIRIALWDDGKGLGDAVSQQGKKSTGSGIGLIEGLLSQLDCNWQWFSENGTRLEIQVPLTKSRLRVR